MRLGCSNHVNVEYEFTHSLPSARKIVIKKAGKGSYVVVMDHEDCIADNEKRKCRKVMESNSLKYFAKRVASFSKTKTSKDNGERI